MGKRPEDCDPADPADAQLGDRWDHIAFDPEHRLVLSAVVGKRTEGNARQVVHEVRERTDGRFLNLIPSEEYPAYQTAILDVYGEPTGTSPKRAGGRRLPDWWWRRWGRGCASC